jgi:hypothetical protein
VPSSAVDSRRSGAFPSMGATAAPQDAASLGEPGD